MRKNDTKNNEESNNTLALLVPSPFEIVSMFQLYWLDFVWQSSSTSSFITFSHSSSKKQQQEKNDKRRRRRRRGNHCYYTEGRLPLSHHTHNLLSQIVDTTSKTSSSISSHKFQSSLDYFTFLDVFLYKQWIFAFGSASVVQIIKLLETIETLILTVIFTKSFTKQFY